MPISATPRPTGSSGNAPAVTNGKALAVVTTIFFMWGFLTCLNDILIPHLKAVFELNYAKAMLVQFTFFGTYFLMSLPAGRLVAALGYKKGIVAGLVIAGIGALGFWPAAELRVYGAFLGALFVLATGITVLQVAANPYVALLGPEQTSSSRLTLAQALNSLGTAIAPIFGGMLILSNTVKSADDIAALPAAEQLAYRAAEAQA
ncbi:MFS transporter, partial [Stenotrophomonas geniculata]